MPQKKESVKVPQETMLLYRKWAKQSGRMLTHIVNQALVFAFSKQSEVEREMASKTR